jgi:GNAT superfamily N-acetyltransferase
MPNESYRSRDRCRIVRPAVVSREGLIMLEYRRLQPGELAKIRDIDRSERVTLSYQVRRGKICPVAVDWDVPAFRPDGNDAHSVGAQIAFCERHLSAGACAIGAFDSGTLAAIGLMTPAIRPGIAQLAYLHVALAYRRTGVASRLFDELLRVARESGARQVYVSATPSESAVGFYQSRGFQLTTPIPELYELEPEDIHMILDLPCSGR